MPADTVKHTPGPWRVKENPRHDAEYCDITICGGGFLLADINGPNFEHQEANAHLIATVPELYCEGSAFLVAVDALCDWMNGNDLSADHANQKPDDFRRLCETMESFRATLAKAEGRP